MKYIKDGGCIYETPITEEIEGCTIELNANQLGLLGYVPLDSVSSTMNYELSNKTFTKNPSLLDLYGFEDPTGTLESTSSDLVLPFIIGKKWKPAIMNGKITYIQVDDENGLGTRNNPIIYSLGVKLIDGAHYTNGQGIYLYSGDNGVSSEDDIINVLGMNAI